jgi:hypothetical protein
MEAGDSVGWLAGWLSARSTPDSAVHRRGATSRSVHRCRVVMASNSAQWLTAAEDSQLYGRVPGAWRCQMFWNVGRMARNAAGGLVTREQFDVWMMRHELSGVITAAEFAQWRRGAGIA